MEKEMIISENTYLKALRVSFIAVIAGLIIVDFLALRLGSIVAIITMYICAMTMTTNIIKGEACEYYPSVSGFEMNGKLISFYIAIDFIFGFSILIVSKLLGQFELEPILFNTLCVIAGIVSLCLAVKVKCDFILKQIIHSTTKLK
ncbi:hypothetical protein [Aureibacter tunicatorum]|uniref:Uncharacterized protein n=1 Tax=Aureibacter tunicatorum TaxID=866807 RepID=A0AAE4BUJ2_9BACT|nr:hypothetical protein [Aureibacter tunicatorum]MDR6240822.1 hypothetical protein [Aureibacter tunicatorum]